MDRKQQPPALPASLMQQSLARRAFTRQGHQIALPLKAKLETHCCRHDSAGPDPAAGARSSCGGLVCRIWALLLAAAHPVSSTWLLFVGEWEKSLLDMVPLTRHWGEWVAGCYLGRVSFLHGKEMYFILHHLQSVQVLKAASVCGSLRTKRGRSLFFSKINPNPIPFSCRTTSHFGSWETHPPLAS